MSTALRYNSTMPLDSRTVSSKYGRTSTGSEDPFAPLILMSGYLVKRTRRGLGAKWQKRYWQLLGDGALIYFSGDHRLKVLGEIDIAHTCYEVRHGSENCEMKFPPAVPPNCCFSVAVLKRTYYFYTFTSEEAEKWVEALNKTSYLINRLRPRSLNCNPAVQVAIRALHEAPQAPVPPSTQPPPSHPAPPPPPSRTSYVQEDEVQSARNSYSDENENFDEPSELPNFSKLSRGRKNLSVPDLRFDSSSITHNGSWIDGSPRIRSSSIATPSPLTSTFTTTGNDLPGGGAQKRRKKVSYSPQFSDIESSMSPSQKTSRSNFRQQRHSMSQVNLLDQGDGIDSTTLPSPAKLAKMKQKWKSAYDVQWTPAFERLEELQKQENAIRKRIEEMKKQDMFSYLPHHGIPVLPSHSNSNTIERTEPSSLSQSMNETTAEVLPSSPTYHSQPSTPSSFTPEFTFSNISSKETNKVPKKAPKTSPKPSGRRPTPAFVHATPLGTSFQKSTRDAIPKYKQQQHAILEESEEPVSNSISLLGENNTTAPQVPPIIIQEPPPTENETTSQNNSTGPNHINSWVKRELVKLIMEIRKIGYQKPDGHFEVKFGVLLEETEGMFEAFLGTLLTARRHKVIHFDGEILLKGVNDDTPITLLKTEI